MAKAKSVKRNTLYCEYCGTQLEEKKSEAGFDMLSGEHLYDPYHICPRRRWFRPWHTKGAFVGLKILSGLLSNKEEE